MKKYTGAAAALGMILTILISDFCGFVSSGQKLDELRGSVLRLHILAHSDDEEEQRLKLCVRDALLEHSGELFGSAKSPEEAERAVSGQLTEIERIAADTLRSQGSSRTVRASLEDVYFEERVYDDLTMPAGVYRALRVEIGSGAGHNWWCVMYPPLCIPAACGVCTDKDAEERYFDRDQRDILYRPRKYRVRFAVWDKLKRFLDR